MAASNNTKAIKSLLSLNIPGLDEETLPDLNYDYTVIYSSKSDELRKILLKNMAVGSGSSAVTVNLTSHGFSVGNVLKCPGGIWGLAKADNAANAETIGVVSSVIDGNNFVITSSGPINLSGLTAGVYFLSDSVAGLYTQIEPTTTGHVSKPVLVAVSSTQAFLTDMRGRIL